jgi:hypothetical protein
MRTWFKDPTTGATVVMALTTVANLIVSAMLWVTTNESVNIARSMYEAGNRPYLGVEGIGTGRDDSKKFLNFRAAIKNFGSAPAEETDLQWDVLLNGASMGGLSIPAKTSSIMPGNTVFLTGHIGVENFNDVISKRSVLQALVYASYKGPNGKGYAYCERSQYEPDVNSFMNLGSCQHPLAKER